MLWQARYADWFLLDNTHCSTGALHVTELAGTVLLIEASTNKMCWRIINSAKSACMMISLQNHFFEHYLLYDVALMTASVLLKVSEMLDVQQSVLLFAWHMLELEMAAVFSARARFAVQHLLAAFRTPKIKSLELEIVDHEVLTIVVHSETGATPSSAHGLHHCA